MATKSLTKEIKITDKNLVRKFIEALDRTEHKKYKSKDITRNCTEITGDKVSEFFDEL